MKHSLCLLVSGNLGFKILKQIHQLSWDLKAVFSDKGSTDIIEYCNSNQIYLFIGNPRSGKSSLFIKDLDIDLLLSVNYLFLIENDLIKLPKKLALNIHGSLLPKYRGRTPHVWAIINGEKKTGITVHLIDQEVDNGDILEQIIVPIRKNDTGSDILSKFNDIYPDVVETILKKIEDNNLVFTKQDSKKATYFGKRTPLDGQIDWNWQRERIRNWIRAQAKPYPGAFTFYKGNKIVIHTAKYSDLGFDYLDTNGKILEAKKNKLFVKTPNGAIELTDLDFQHPIKFTKGELLI